MTMVATGNPGYFRCIPLMTFDTSTLSGSYQAVNPSGFPLPIKIFKFWNTSSSGITVSYDGVNDHDYYQASGGMILDLQTNHENTSAYGSGTLNGRAGQVIYVKGSTSAGTLYLVGYY